MVKKLARYQQYRAVNKAIEIAKGSKGVHGKGGIIWHWQGSGKSLIMLWLALKLRREQSLKNPTLLIITDRTQLDEQISGTFERCGFPNPEHAEDSKELRRLLKIGSGQTILTTVQKFLSQEGEKKGEFPVLSTLSNIFILVDEAQRTQYKDFAANMRQALPNACYFAFTGTPIDKKDRSTPSTFGDYIDKYTMEQAVKDKATVPIYYESRLPQLSIEGESIDSIFDRVFAGLSDKEKQELKRRYVNETAIAGARQRIEKICLDLLDHYEKFIKPNGFKAQIVAADRKAALQYKLILDKLNVPKSALIVSEGEFQNDLEATNQLNDILRKQEAALGTYKQITGKGGKFQQPMEKNDLSIVIVCDMLLTGFDAPIEQVMYLDSPLKEHNLLQAIARVDRPYEKKSYGLIIDYYGISNFLSQALEIFNSQDIHGVLRKVIDQLPILQSRHRKVMAYFNGIDKSKLDECISVLENEETRAEFDLDFKRFAESMDMVMPDPAANPYREDLKILGKIRNAARLRFRDEQMSVSQYGAKVRKLIEEHIRATGVDPLLKPMSILDKNFKSNVERLTSNEAKASEMEHALTFEIKIKREENPVFYDSLKKRLETLIEERKQRRLDMARLLIELNELTNEVKNIQDKAKALGLDKFEFGIYGILETARVKDDLLKQLTKRISEELKNIIVIDWTSKEDVQREARRAIKRTLRNVKCDEETIDIVVPKVMDLAKVHLAK